jgi:hypothetical protein
MMIDTVINYQDVIYRCHCEEDRRLLPADPTKQSGFSIRARIIHSIGWEWLYSRHWEIASLPAVARNDKVCGNFFHQ